MSNCVRLQDRLEILLITYNRCDYLSDTLKSLAQSPFKECHITVIDNCSPDATSETVAGFNDRFPNLSYLRNRVNISGNPNYLKAIELSISEYTWILCDDDFLDFSDCNDVIEAVESGTFDLVEVGATEKDGWPRGTATSVVKLLDQGIDYYFRMSFFPAFIFRTSLFDSACFCWGYKHIDHLYPQFEFLDKSVREDFSIYLARKRIVTRNDVNDQSFSPLVWYASWLTCCRTISNSKVRSLAIDDATADRGFFKCLGFWTVLDRKMNDDGEFWLRIIGIFNTLNGRQRFKYLLVLPFVFLPFPLSFWVWIRSTLYRLMNVPESEVPPLRFVNR